MEVKYVWKCPALCTVTSTGIQRLINWLLLYVEPTSVMSKHVGFNFSVYSTVLFVIVFYFDRSSCIYYSILQIMRCSMNSEWGELWSLLVLHMLKDFNICVGKIISSNIYVFLIFPVHTGQREVCRCTSCWGMPSGCLTPDGLIKCCSNCRKKYAASEGCTFKEDLEI